LRAGLQEAREGREMRRRTDSFSSWSEVEKVKEEKTFLFFFPFTPKLHSFLFSRSPRSSPPVSRLFFPLLAERLVLDIALLFRG